MSLDRSVLAEKVAAVERHLSRVADRLPDELDDFKPSTDASDAVILHLWLAVQLVINLALKACPHLGLGPPDNYGDAFQRLAENGYLDEDLSRRLIKAAGFRNAVAHVYEKLDMALVYRAATDGPEDLRRFLASLRDVV